MEEIVEEYRVLINGVEITGWADGDQVIVVGGNSTQDKPEEKPEFVKELDL